jgi:hypothetical protein
MEFSGVYINHHHSSLLCVALSPTQQFEQVSFVNGICTYQGLHQGVLLSPIHG